MGKYLSSKPSAIMWLSLVLLIQSTALANPVIIAPGLVMAKGAAIGMGIDLVVDGLVLVLAYLLFRKAGSLAKWPFLKQWAMVFVTGLLIDLFIYAAAGGLITSGPGTGTLAVMGFLALASANYLIAITRPGFSRMQALITAALVGILTNPVLFELALKASGFQLELIPKSSMGGF